MKKGDYIWRRKIYFFQRRAKPGKKTEEYVWGKKCFLKGRRITAEEKEENIWRTKICFFAKEKNNGEGKGGSFARGQSIQMIICKRPVDRDDHLQEVVPS